jgi:hypothetical protein
MSWWLWNQMFQYACIRAFQIKYWYPVDELYLDFSEIYSKSDSWKFNWLRDFNIKSYKEKKASNTFFQNFLILILRAIRVILLGIFEQEKVDAWMYKIQKKIQPFYNKLWIYWFRLWYYDFPDSKADKKIFYWTFESSKFFDNIKDILLEEFTPKYWILQENTELYKQIADTQSVCVHVRLWDFLSEKYRDRHYVCTPTYFEHAIAKIKTLVKNPKFFVFSDDIERVKKNITFPDGTYYEKWNLPVWESFRLMYSCKHFIISNSTFSRWAQYLSRNPDKIVLAPSIRWNNCKYLPKLQKMDIYMDDRILIDV